MKPVLFVYDLVHLYNKCALIKVAPKVHSNGIITPTNFATPNIHFVLRRVKHTYFSYKSIVVFIVEIAYFFHRIVVQNTPPKFGLHSVKSKFTIYASL